MPRRPEIPYHYRGGTERSAQSHGKPSYVWHDGYSTDTPDGHPTAPWMTVSECRAEAMSNGGKAVFYRDGKRMP